MAKTGRKQIEIDAEQVEKLASYGNTTKDMADFFMCSPDTLQRRFAAEIAKGRANLHMTLREYQWKYAKQGNAALLIFLGKHYLKQSDNQQTENNEPIKLAYKEDKDDSST